MIGLTQIEVNDPFSALEVMDRGLMNRIVASNKVNESSSRSHCVTVSNLNSCLYLLFSHKMRDMTGKQMD